MRRFLVAAAGILLALSARPLHAQDWTPPSREMPPMPRMDELSGAWKQTLAAWFGGVEAVSGVPMAEVRATGDGRGGRTQQVRFAGGVRPVASWTDRNGDGRCDMLEIFHDGSVAYQVIDADFDGQANVVRVYDARGNLKSETRL